MSSSPITGFVKKKVAAKKYKRSARQLTRDITVAMELKDEKVLQHLKLRTTDGEVFDGGEVTTELVNTLHKAEGRNPIWYLRRTWLEQSFGERDFLKSQIEAKDTQLNSALERDRESNVLLKNLQELMGNLQEELLALPTGNTAAEKQAPAVILQSAEAPQEPSDRSAAGHGWG